MKVPRQVFIPAPNVDSAIVKIYVKQQKKMKPVNESHFYKLVRNAFHMRRKTLANNLVGFLEIDKKTIQEDLLLLGYKTTVRAEELGVEDFIRISDYYQQ